MSPAALDPRRGRPTAGSSCLLSCVCICVPEAVRRRALQLRRNMELEIQTAGGVVPVRCCNGTGQGTNAAAILSILPLELKTRFISKMMPGEVMVARKVLRRSVGVKAHCDDTSYAFTGVWGPIKLEGATAAGWVASELIQGIPNGAAKSGVSLQEWDGTDVEGKWGIVLPSGKDNDMTSWNRVNDKKDPYVTLGFPETGAINYRLADDKSIHNIGMLTRVASNAGGADVAEQRGILMMASAGNPGVLSTGRDNRSGRVEGSGRGQPRNPERAWDNARQYAAVCGTCSGGVGRSWISF